MGKWEKVRLGDVCDVRDGTHDSPKYCEVGYPLITSKNIVNGQLDFKSVNYISKNDFDAINNRSQVDIGDIIMPMIGTIGNPLIVETKKQFAIKNVALFKFSQGVVTNTFVYYILISEIFLEYIKKENRGGTQKFLSLKNIREFEIPLPPLEIQQKIAATLDTAAALLKLRQQQLAELEALIQSVFYQMFGDPVRNEKGWEARYLKDLYLNGNSAIKCGPFGSALKKDEFSSVGVAVWNMDNINKKYQFVKAVNLRIPEEKFKVLTAYNVENGDIIISRAGTVGKMCVVNSEENKSIISTNLIRLRLNNILLLPIYFVSLMHYWGTRVAQLKKGEEGTFTHMNTGVLDSIYFPLPPLSLQTQFAAIVQKIDQQKALVQQSIDETQTLFDSLMSQYFD